MTKNQILTSYLSESTFSLKKWNRVDYIKADFFQKVLFYNVKFYIKINALPLQHILQTNCYMIVWHLVKTFVTYALYTAQGKSF